MISQEKREWLRRLIGPDLKLGPDADDGPVADGSGGGGDPSPPGTASPDHTDLPQPMLPDCQIVRGVVPAPDNFVLCAMHGHILDTDTKQIVASNLKEFEAQHPEYGKLPMKMAADCAPERGKVLGPANHVLCGKHGHVLDIRAKQVIAYSLKDYTKRFPPKKPEPPVTPPKTASPPFDRKHAQDTLRDILSGTSVLVGDFQNRRNDFNTSLQMLVSGSCGGAAINVRSVMADTDAPLHELNEAAGEYIAESATTAPTKIPAASQEARDALKRLSIAVNLLKQCLDHPPPPPPPAPAPDGVDSNAWKAQQDLVRRRDDLMSRRAFIGKVEPLRDLGEKIQQELETASDVAKALMAS